MRIVQHKGRFFCYTGEPPLRYINDISLTANDGGEAFSINIFITKQQ